MRVVQKVRFGTLGNIPQKVDIKFWRWCPLPPPSPKSKKSFNATGGVKPRLHYDSHSGLLFS